MVSGRRGGDQCWVCCHGVVGSTGVGSGVGVWGMGGVGRVEGSCGTRGVVSVTCKGADAQIVVGILAGAQGVADRVGQQRNWALITMRNGDRHGG